MKYVKWVVLGFLVMSSLSCVWSLLPLFEDRYLVSEPGLIGTWKQEDGGDTWAFEAGEGKVYRLIQRQAEYNVGKGMVPGEAARFQARLGRLGGQLFLDLFPADEDNMMPHNDWLNIHLIRAHTLARVWLGKDSLRLVFLEQDWISKMIEGGRITLAHVKTEDGFVLTAPTAELQSFIIKYAGDPEAFPPGAGEKEGAVKLSRAR